MFQPGTHSYTGSIFSISAHRRRHFGDFPAFDPVGHADGNLLEFVEHVELGDDDAVETVDRRSVTEQRDIEPAAAARPAGDGAEFLAAAADLLARSVQRLGRKRAAADAGDICLGYADDAADAGGRNACAGAGAAGARAGGSDERICAVIDVEHGALRAFEEHALAVADRLVQQAGGIAHHRPDALRERLVFVANTGEVEFFVDAERLGDGDLLLHQRVVLGAEEFRVHQIGHADSAAGDLVLVARPDTARGGADGDAARAAFRHLLHHAVGRQEDVRPIADEQVLRDMDAGGFERIDFRQQSGGIDHQSVADDRLLARPQNAARNELEHVFAFADEDGVAGVVPALVARDDIERSEKRSTIFPLPSSPHWEPRMMTLPCCPN